MSRWFRFHAEALNDPKVQRLDGETFKIWVNLLCLASKHKGKLPPMVDIAFALRMDVTAARAVVERLLTATLIDKASGGVDGYTYAPHAWAERQYKSDTSTERVKRFRKRSEAVTETPPDTDTEQSNSVAKATGASADPEKDFWTNAKAHIGGSNPGALIGKWKRDFGLPETKAAITASQLERSAHPPSFITATLRRQKSRAVEMPYA